MDRLIGISTGSLAIGDYKSGVAIARAEHFLALELSAIREHEFRPLINDLRRLDLEEFRYVSIHVPSKLLELTEKDVVSELLKVADLRFPAVVHADIIKSVSVWSALGDLLLIENMDKRKSTGRYTSELEPLFERLPQARFCFDIAHVRQVDPTMTEAAAMLRMLASRTSEIHISELTSSSRHERLSLAAVYAYQKVAHLIPPDAHAIIESPIPQSESQWEIRMVQAALDPPLIGSAVAV
jgi:hypothetical protein